MQLDFDDQGEAGKFAIEWWGRMMHGPGPVLPEAYRYLMEGSPRMLNDIEYVPLQAADMLAWTIRSDIASELDRGWYWLKEELISTMGQICPFLPDQWQQIRDAIQPFIDIYNATARPVTPLPE